MKLTLDALRIVIAVEREGGVNRAARSLNKVPSAVSHTIHKLERELDAKLFVKRGRSLVITDAGARLVEHGDRLLEQALDLETSVRRIANGWDIATRVAISDVVPIDWILSIIEELSAVTAAVYLHGVHVPFSTDLEFALFTRPDVTENPRSLHDAPQFLWKRLAPMHRRAAIPHHQVHLLPHASPLYMKSAGGSLPDFVEREFEDFIGCGDLQVM